MDYNAMTKTELEDLAAGYGNSPVPQELTDHIEYRSSLAAYAADVADKAVNGIGSNPPGNPPRPPGL